MATLLEKLQQGSQPTTGGSLLERLQQAEQQGLIQRGQPTQAMQSEEQKASPIFPGLAKAAATGGAAISGIAKTLASLPGGRTQEEKAELQETLTKERNVLGLGRSRPAGIDEYGQEKSFGGQVKDIFGAGLETGSFFAPGQIGRGVLAGTAKVLPSMAAGAVGGGIGATGGAMAGDESFKDIVKEGAIGTLAGGAVGALVPGVGALARKAPQIAKQVPDIAAGVSRKAQDIATGLPGALKTGARVVQRGFQSIPERAGALGTNIADIAGQAAETATKSAPIRQAISANIPERVIDIVQTANNDTVSAIKAMRNAANNKVAPKKVLARVASERVRFARKQAQNIGKEMDKAIDNMMLKQPNVANPRMEMLQVLADNGVTLNSKGQVMGTGGFTTEQARLLKRLVDELPKGQLMTPKQIVLAKRKLSNTISEASQLKGISPSQISVVTSRLEDVLTKQLSDEYRALSKEYAILKGAIDEFLQFIGATKKSGALYTIEDALTADTRIGSRLMRLLNADASKAEETLKMVDDAVKRFGYPKGEDIASLAEVSNALEQIYDMVPSRSFKGGITEGVAQGITQAGSVPGMVLQAAAKATGASRANQKKAFDALLQAIAEMPVQPK
jgi:hypothetical protein